MPVERRAIGAVLIAVVLWSATSLFVRAGHSDALVFTTWRLWFALPPLATIVWWRSRRVDTAPFWPDDMPRLRWIALLVGAGAFFVSGAATTFAALGLTRLLDVTLIGSLQPVLIIGFAVAFLGERVARTHLARGGSRDRGDDHGRGRGVSQWYVEPHRRCRRRRGSRLQLGLVPLRPGAADADRRRSLRVHVRHVDRGRGAHHTDRARRSTDPCTSAAAVSSMRPARCSPARPRTC